MVEVGEFTATARLDADAAEAWTVALGKELHARVPYAAPRAHIYAANIWQATACPCTPHLKAPLPTLMTLRGAPETTTASTLRVEICCLDPEDALVGADDVLAG